MGGGGWCVTRDDDGGENVVRQSLLSLPTYRSGFPKSVIFTRPTRRNLPPGRTLCVLAP